jgi:hypothetical protein
VVLFSAFLLEPRAEKRETGSREFAELIPDKFYDLDSITSAFDLCDNLSGLHDLCGKILVAAEGHAACFALKIQLEVFSSGTAFAENRQNPSSCQR